MNANGNRSSCDRVWAGLPGHRSTGWTPAPRMCGGLFRLAVSHATIGGLLAVCGCAVSTVQIDEAAQRQMLELLLPDRIEIVEPFTRVKSFDDDAVPDGIELLLQAVNPLDNPGLMIVGRVRVELYEYLPSTGDHKGRRMENWDIELVTTEQQRKHWNALTQMYEFRLGINPETIAPADQQAGFARKFVLTATYLPPVGDRLSDECVLQYDAASSRTGG